MNSSLPDSFLPIDIFLQKCILSYEKNTMATQISAEISESTRNLLETYVKNSGIKKGFLIEQAVLNYIRALNQLPMDILVPAKVVVTSKSAHKMVKHLARSPRPTAKLRRLMADED